MAKYKGSLLLCRNKEHDFHDESFSRVADHTIAKMMTCTCLQQAWVMNHSDFDNAFPSGRLDRSVHVELLKYVYSDDEKSRSVMRLNRPLYGLKKSARTWSRGLFSEFKKLGNKNYAARRS